MRPMLPCLIFVLVAPTALAGDGALEIHQSCAAGAGCFPGDAAGFPVTITAPGSYRLTSNLILPNENTNGIVVDASHVSIDLNEHRIAGPVSCIGSPLVCTPSTGTGTGIDFAAIERIGVSVTNGGVEGMGLDAVVLGDHSIVKGLRVRSNRNRGIRVGAASVVRDNVVTFNGGTGIFADDGSVVTNNTSNYGGSIGIDVDNGVTLARNGVYGNDSHGISVGAGVSIVDNVSGVNGGHGILASNSCLVQRNSLVDNEDHGLRSIVTAVETAYTAYKDNSIRTNILGTVTGGVVDAGGNDCDGTVSCP